MHKYLTFMIITFSFSAIAEEIEIPNEFFSGGKALASEVNENFDVLVNESNAQNARISVLEASSISNVSDQLICRTPLNWLVSGAATHCVKKSDASNVTYPTYAVVASEGWIVSSIGGDGGGSNIYVFSK
ncbi:hypothetical protein ACJJIE_10740 [Microbulbifer sp. TRSA001]|uniref:hypothetical protein n=1 Tax=Microbulbifer sp. TRSA001 TaxID=3243381 RepID=UPI00403A6F53